MGRRFNPDRRLHFLCRRRLARLGRLPFTERTGVRIPSVVPIYLTFFVVRRILISMKKCRKCNEIKDLSCFCADRKMKDGKQSYCKECKSKLISEYYKKNPKKRQYSKKKSLEKYYKHKVHNNVARLVRLGLNGRKNNKTFDLLGYSEQQLKEHLEKQFVEGMTWENYGKWHIDHKTPRASLPYQLSTDDNFKKCWALENLQPLWAIDNRSKSDKCP